MNFKKDELEKWLKKSLKNKISFTEGTLVAFLMAGFIGISNIAYGAVYLNTAIDPTTNKFGAGFQGDINDIAKAGNIIMTQNEIPAGVTEVVAIGDGVNATSSNTVAVGHTSTASGTSSVAVGHTSTASGTSSVAIGDTALATGTDAIAVGHDAKAEGNENIAIGKNARVKNKTKRSTSVGADTYAAGISVLGVQRRTLV